VVTRPGGSLDLPDGHVNFDPLAFPRLRPGVTCLQFLRYIPQSSSYQALDADSTLVASGENWTVLRRAFAGFVLPGFTRRAFEVTVANWLADCYRKGEGTH